MSLHSSYHLRISKEAVSTEPLFQMKMTLSRLVALTIGFTAILTGTLIGRLGRHGACLISLGMYLPRSTNRLIAGRYLTFKDGGADLKSIDFGQPLYLGH